MFDVLESLYVLFTSSTSRHEKLQYLLNNQEEGEKTRIMTLRNLSKTRWSACPDAIEAVVAGFKPIISALNYYSSDESVDKDTMLKAKALLN